MWFYLPQTLASMRPRPGGRGETIAAAVAPAVAGFNAATTRRPWRDFGRKPSRLDGIRLQCGHDPEAVESTAVLQVARPTTVLQCGHDPEAVDEVWGRTTAARQRFNAATTRRPWRAWHTSCFF